MKPKLLHCFFIIFYFIYYSVTAQYKLPKDSLQKRMQQYATVNNLKHDEPFIYFDAETKKPYRLTVKDGLIEGADASQPIMPSPPAANSITAGNNFHLIRDLDSSTDANPATSNFSNKSNIISFTTLDGVAYFSADDGFTV